MAAGNLIYVGKSRLRRKYRQKRIENKIKRQERRKAERELRRTPSPRSDTVSTCSSGDDSGHDEERENRLLRHWCRFCDDGASTDSLGLDSSSGSDSEDLTPLIECLSLRPGNKMPFGPFKKKIEADKEDPQSDVALDTTGNDSTVPEVQEKQESQLSDKVKALEEQLQLLQGLLDAKTKTMSSSDSDVVDELVAERNELLEAVEEDIVDECIKGEEAVAVFETEADVDSPLCGRKRHDSEDEDRGSCCCVCSIM